MLQESYRFAGYRVEDTRSGRTFRLLEPEGAFVKARPTGVFHPGQDVLIPMRLLPMLDFDRFGKHVTYQFASNPE